MQSTGLQIKCQQGFSLLEVLIAILILAIGLLGMAQLQGSGMRSSHGAYLRTQATILAADILDSMRANPTVARSGGYNANLQATYTQPSDPVAQVDVNAWKANLAALLPNGDGRIVTSGSDVSVVVQWSGLREGENAGLARTITFTVDSTI